MVGWILAGIAGLLIIGWFYFRRGDSDFRSLIVLLREPRLVTPEHVKIAADKAGLDFTSIEGEHPIQIKHAKVEFYLGSHPNSYGNGKYGKERLAESIRDLRMREAYLEHNAWFSTAVERIPEGSTPEEAYGVMGKLTAELLDDTCLIVWSAEDNRINLITPELIDSFREGKPIEALQEVRGDEITNVDSEDSRMKAAIAEARTRWPEFVSAYQKANKPEEFIVKFPFGEPGDHVEHMWIEVHGIEGNQVSGKLLSDPFKLRGYKQGQDIQRQAEELSDWLYLSETGPVGAFSEEIVRGG